MVYVHTNATSQRSGASLENSQERSDGTECSDSTQHTYKTQKRKSCVGFVLAAAETKDGVVFFCSVNSSVVWTSLYYVILYSCK